MQSGVPIWQAAGFLGMTTETLERVYGHHHPDFLNQAVEGIARRPGPGQNKHVSLVIPLVHAPRANDRSE
jgi:hypothetical protein